MQRSQQLAPYLFQKQSDSNLIKKKKKSVNSIAKRYTRALRNPPNQNTFLPHKYFAACTPRGARNASLTPTAPLHKISGPPTHDSKQPPETIFGKSCDEPCTSLSHDKSSEIPTDSPIARSKLPALLYAIGRELNVWLMIVGTKPCLRRCHTGLICRTLD